MSEANSGTIPAAANTAANTEDVPEVVIEAKDQEFIPQSEMIAEEMNEEDPRAAIYKKYDQKRAEEMGLVPAEEAPAPKAEAAPEAPESLTPEEVTVKINGKERKVPKAEVDEAGGVKAYQKAKAADEMLRQASEELRRARETEALMQQKLQTLEQQERALQERTQQAPAAMPDGTKKELARKYHEAILDGNMDMADELLLKLNAAPGATADVEAITRRAAAAAKAELLREQEAAKRKAFETERIEASASFADDFPDIAEDPELFKITNAKTVEIYQKHPDWTPKTIFKAAVDDVRTWIAGRTGAAQTSNSDKLDAKRQTTSIRAGSARVVSKPPPKPQTSSQYVEQLRRSRGLDI